MDSDQAAFGSPGIEPRWTEGNKSGVGTAYSASSRIWFTLFSGIVTEVYYPTVDRPQMRDLQFLVTDGKSFLHEEKRHLVHGIERLTPHALGYRCTSTDPAGRYALTKTIITDPHLPCLLQRTTLTVRDSDQRALKLFALCAPRLEGGGADNSGYVLKANGQQILMAKRGTRWLAMAASVPFARVSCGFVGRSDGWTDLHENFQMDYEFQRAEHGNIALTGELDLGKTREFTLATAFGDTEHRAITSLLQSLGTPFDEHLAHFTKQWDAAATHARRPKVRLGDGGRLFDASYSLLLAHEDKVNPGALVASLAIPWGEVNGDADQGGYHLVWTRDMVNSATGLLAAGNTATPLRALIFLAVSQHADGGFSQNFWVDGDAYWTGKQLDEVAFPIMLARRLARDNALGGFDPYELVRKAAAYLVRMAPVTDEERWEEASGYSPSTLAATIAALVCAAAFFRDRGDEDTARFVEEHADFLEANLEAWTVTHDGSLLPRTPTYYLRLLPEERGADDPATRADDRLLEIKNLEPSQQSHYPAKDVVDGGFLELVRYGIRAPDDPIIVSTVQVIDATLKVNTPAGPAWHRYNHDGYGQKADGGPYTGTGQGRAWPLLTGERGHYELAAGRSAAPYIQAMERFSSEMGLIPEQVWDGADEPDVFMFKGKPTGSANPLMWAHAEYMKLLRSVADGVVYDRIPEVLERYVTRRGKRERIDIWKADRPVRSIEKGSLLRVHGAAPFRLRWSTDGWLTHEDTMSSVNRLEIDFADVPTTALSAPGAVDFTFFWVADERWEGRDYRVTVRS